MHIESVQEIFHADIMGSKRRRIILQKPRSRAGYRSRGISVIGGINQDDVPGSLKRLEQYESAGTAIEALHIRWEGRVFQGSHHMDADALVAHDHIPEPQNE